MPLSFMVVNFFHWDCLLVLVQTERREICIMNTINLEILGSGCKKCQQLEENVHSAIASLKVEAEVFHVTDPIEIAQRGVLSTPALAINGKVVSKGKVLSPEQIQPLLQSSLLV